MINRKRYQNFMIIDGEGTIIYADVEMPAADGGKQENLRGKKLENLFTCEGEYPTVCAARTGVFFDEFTVEIVTCDGMKQIKKGCAYPIFDDRGPVAALEFYDIFYEKKNIRKIGEYSDHLIYRANNTKYILDDIITVSSSMEEIKRNIEKIALTEANVLIYGETGTGKELVAQAIHNESRRYNKKFISINCGALPASIIESLLFGTLKGSFTGAGDNAGLFEQAEGGTLFLDEINSLDMALQVKILKAIESKKVRRIGSLKEKVIDVRIVSATNEDPRSLIESKRLKPDLFYRLSTIYFKLPGLAERRVDIIVLADYFRTYFNKKMNLKIEPFDEEIKNIFLRYDWPGNVRELRNVIESAFAFADGNKITKEDIPPFICENRGRRLKTESDEIYGTEDFLTLPQKTELLETHIIESVYEANNGSLTNTAKCLSISKQLLRYKLSKRAEGIR